MTEQIDPDVLKFFNEMQAAKDEPLHPDLAEYLVESEHFGMVLKHPLVVDILPINGYANARYLARKAELDDAIAEEDWKRVVWIHERPYRCEALIDYVLGRNDETGVVFPVTSLTDPMMRRLVWEVWTDSENIHQHVQDWLEITDGFNPGDPILFGEQKNLDELPDRIELWRGDCNDGGWSWTTDKKIALFFAKRNDEGNDLLHGFVDKRNIFGYIVERNESEVMVRREYVEDIESVDY